MPVSEATYERLALEDPEGHWEFVCGRPRSKPGITARHNGAADELARQLHTQLDPDAYRVRTDNGLLRISTGNYYVPDLFVLPQEYFRSKAAESDTALEVYDEPMPLVVEVWSPSTGEYDVEQKLRDYQLRGDAEIWRVHPYEKTLTAWRCRSDGAYDEIVCTGGEVQPVALLEATIDLPALFE